MKRFTTLVTTLLALSLWAGSNQPAIADQGRNSTPDNQHRDPKSNGKPGQVRNGDSDRDHDKGKGQSDHHDPRDCADDRHDHGHAHPKPPKPPKPPHDHTQPLPAPTGLSAEAVSLFQVNLKWKDNSTNELGFKIERSQNGKDFAQIAQVLPNTTTYRDLNRFPDTKYFYRARAFGAKGESAHSNVALTQTPAPECRLSVIASRGIGYGNPALDNYELVAMAAGEYRRLALTADRTVIDLANYTVNQVSNLTDVVAIAAGEIHGLALKNDGTVVGWGEDNYYGQATPPPNLTNVTAIAAGAAHSLALKNDGTVVAWGNDIWWQARPPANLTGVVAIAGGLYHSLALRSDGTVVGWGFNDQNAAQPPPGLREVIAIAAGSSHSLALRGDGTVVGWGNSVAAIIPTNLSGVVAIAAGDNYSAALRSDGSVTGWGYNGVFPTPVPSLDTGFTNVVALKIGGQNSMMLTTLPSNPSVLEIKLHTNNQVYLHWDDASVGETRYLVERDLVETSGDYVENWELIAALDANSTNFVDTSAIGGATYAYAIRSQNSCGTSPFGVGGIVAISSPTNEPYFTSVTARGDNAILSFAIQSWSGASLGVIEYRLERATVAGAHPGEWQEIAVVQPNPSPYYYSQESSYTDPDLAVNSTNWYRVRAVNGLGISPYSQPRSVSITLPATPQYLSKTINDTDHVRLSWGGYGWNDLVGSRIERATNVLTSPGPWKEIAVLPVTNPPVREYADATALPGTIYWYRIWAFNDTGISAYSQPTQVDLLSPPQLSVFPTAISNSVFLTTYASFPPSDGGVHINFDYSTSQQLQFERSEDVNGAPGSWKSILPKMQSNPYTYADFGLAPDKTYWYRARISTWLGDSPYSTPVSVTIVPPQPPLEVRAHIGSTHHITLRWRPAYRYDLWPMNLQEQFGYKIERAIETNTWTEIATVGLTNSRYYSFDDSVSGAGQTYRYRVRSFNSAGQSTYAESFPITLLPPPQPSLGASVYINQVQLGFYLSVVGVTGFRIERAPDAGGSPGAWSRLATIPAEESAGSNYTDILPFAETGYWYRVQAYNWVGDSQFSAPVAALVQPPQAPTFYTYKIGSTNQLELFWNHTGRDAERFIIERAERIGGNLGNWAPLRTLELPEATTPNGLSCIDSNVSALGEYAYRIRALSAIGSSDYSAVLPVLVAPPAPPTGLALTCFGGQVSLNWYPPENYYYYGVIEGYEIERAVESGGVLGSWRRIAHTYEYTYLDASPPAGSICWYRVRSRNWVGGSDFTAATSVAITPPRKPESLSATLGQTNQVDITLYTVYPRDYSGLQLERAPDISGTPGTWEEIATIVTNGSPATCIDSNAVAYTTNWYRARAFHRGGISEPTEPVQCRILPPSPPQQFNIAVAAEEVRIYWQHFTVDFINGFTVERADDNGGTPENWSALALVTGEFNPSGWWAGRYTNIVVTPNKSYWYRVRAYNWVGLGTPSEEKIVTVTPPPPPTWVRARVGNTNEAIVTWWDVLPTTNGGYQIERAANNGGVPGDWHEIGSAGIKPQIYFYDTNVTAYTTNWYRVRGYNLLGTSAYSDPVELRLTPPPPPWHSSTFVYADRVNFSWTDWSPEYGTVAGYEIERTLDAGGTPGIWTGWGISTATAIDDLNLTPDTTYWYRVRAYNWIGLGAYSAPVSATIRPPGEPNTLWAFVTATNEIRLQWYAGNPNDQDAFTVERQSDKNAVWTMIATIPATNLSWASYADTNVIPNVAFHYRVRAFNIVGYSSYSDIASATISGPTTQLIAPAQPRILALTPTNSDILITWTAASGSTNVVEATASLQTTFQPISPSLILHGSDSQTANFLDAGALTNSTSRFYRIREVR